MIERNRPGARLAIDLALLAASLALAVGLLELAVRGLDLFPEARRAAARARASLEEGESAIGTVLHPYLGWIKRPGSLRPERSPRESRAIEERPGAAAPVNLLGFRSHIEDYRRLPESDFAIGCFGGSVAAELCLKDGDLIVAALEARRPDLAGSIRILNFSSEAYKQPQQLFALTMALLLGVKLDAAFSLDGFNEVSMGGTDVRLAHHPLWPSRRALLRTLSFATGDLSEEEIRDAARIVELRRRIRRRRALVSGASPLGSLESARALVGLLVLRDEAAAGRAEAALQARPDTPAAEHLATLDDECLERSRRRAADPSCWELIADLAAESTGAMDALARSHGILFLHLLQPSQYLPGSKPLSEEEQQLAIDAELRYDDYVSQAYPVLRERFRELASEGVRTVDLSGIFAGNLETLYRDTCCHLNRRGNELLADRIADLLAERLPPDSR